MNYYRLKACGKCGGDLVRDEGDWICLQCGVYYYTGLYRPADWPADLPDLSNLSVVMSLDIHLHPEAAGSMPPGGSKEGADKSFEVRSTLSGFSWGRLGLALAAPGLAAYQAVAR